jgi:hypothetical protein
MRSSQIPYNRNPDNAQKKYSWFIEEINPKSLRLIMETTTKYDLAFAHTHEYLKIHQK